MEKVVSLEGQTWIKGQYSRDQQNTYIKKSSKGFEIIITGYHLKGLSKVCTYHKMLQGKCSKHLLNNYITIFTLFGAIKLKTVKNEQVYVVS